MDLWRQQVTVWHAGERRHVGRVALEESRAAEFGAAHPSEGSSLTVYVKGDPGIEAGDYLVPGLADGEKPPEGALRVRAVKAYSLAGRPHHVEVSAG